MKVNLRKATPKDEASVVDFDYKLNMVEHVALKRAEKIAKAIREEECFIIEADSCAVGFALFDYRFFDQGWIELLVVEEEHRGKGIGVEVLRLLCKQSKTSKVFTSTNRFNTPMQRALDKAGFSFAGEIIGLDEGDPERFYFKIREDREDPAP